MKLVDDTATQDKKIRYKTKMDSTYALIHGNFPFPTSIEDELPLSSADYFTNIQFPYRFPNKLAINFFCKMNEFKLKDYFIFNKKNNTSSCEYVALIDTTGYSKVIARKCIEMEGWITLFVFDKNYKILSSELLLISGGDWPGGDIDYEGKKVTYKDGTDSLVYSQKVYRVIHSEIYRLTDIKNGTTTEELGYQSVKKVMVNPDGKIVATDSISLDKKYVRLLRNAQKY